MTYYNTSFDEKENNEMKIALKLLHLRQDNNLSSENLAQIIGISQKELSKYESAEENIPASILYLVSLAFDINIEYFYEYSEEFVSYEIPIDNVSCNNFAEIS